MAGSSKQARGWIGTVWAKHGWDEQKVSETIPYPFVAQREASPTTGEEHFQIYLESPGAIRLSTLVKLFPQSHWEPRKGSKRQAWDYCTKEASRVGEPFSSGEIELDDRPGQRTDLDVLRDAVFSGQTVREILIAEPAAARYVSYLDRLMFEHQAETYGRTPRLDLHVSYVWGEPGSGKTRGVYEEHGYDAVYRVTDYSHPFDAYNGEKILVLDEFHGQLTAAEMLDILDVHPVQLRARYSNRWAAFTKVYVLSNLDLVEQYRTLQSEKPMVWDALLRRIHEVRYVPLA